MHKLFLFVKPYCTQKGQIVYNFGISECSRIKVGGKHGGIPVLLNHFLNNFGWKVLVLKLTCCIAVLDISVNFRYFCKCVRISSASLDFLFKGSFRISDFFSDIPQA